MTAGQVIQQIKRLPPKERGRVIELVHQLERERHAPVVDEKAFEKASERVLNRHAPLMRKLAS